MNSINSIFEDFGLSATNRIRLAEELSLLHDGELQSIVQSFSSVDIPVYDNEKVNNLTKRYALIRAFETGAESITEEDMTWAHEKASAFAMKHGTFSVKSDAITENSEVSTASQNDSTPSKRTRNPKLYPAIKRLVRASSEASKETITEQVEELFPGTVEGTIVMYYYKARKELGLKNAGKRGRKASKVYPTVLELVKTNLKLERKELVELAVASGVNESTANVYVGKAMKELEG